MPISELKPRSNRKSSSIYSSHWSSRTIKSVPKKTKGVGYKISKKITWGKAILSLGVALVLFVGIVLIIVNRDLPTPEGLAHRVVPQSTKIYDRTGKIVLYDIHGAERRTSVSLSEIPRTLKLATLAAEDRNFYEHGGFQLTSMIRSVLVNLMRGERAQGGSTITQQLIKNAILGSQKTFARKLRELILAYQIEKYFSKDEILQLYFNEIPYTSTAYGAEAGAQAVFGKSVKDLNLAESALLAALPKATTYYSPWGTHRDDLIGRQQYILNAMLDLGEITKAEAAEARAFKLVFQAKRESIIAPHFVFYVRELLTSRYGESLVNQGGLKVTTTLDLDLQKSAETAVTGAHEKNLKYNAQNASLVALDVPTGQILSMVGSNDYFDDEHDGQVNVSLRPRQPGSSFKPIVYAAAFELGFKPETILFDVNTVFKTDSKDYEPHDYDSKERGPVSLRQALAGSLNIPAVKLLYLTGIDRVLALAKNLGYTTLENRSRFGLSLVLGGAEVKLLEHVAAFASFAREGVYKKPQAILKVEDAKGNTLEEFQDEAGAVALNPETARTLSDVLSDNQARTYIFGANNHLTLPDRPVATKTGTTNDYHDAWTLGYTPQIATGVWVGNNNNKEMKRGADGSVVAAPIWQNFMIAATAKLPVATFTPPNSGPAPKPILNGILGQEVVIDSVTGKLATEATPPEYRVNKIYPSYHTILKHVVPGDPLGAGPANPADDQQFAGWEEAIQKWAQSQNLNDTLPPSDYDDVHKSEFAPQVKINSPSDNQAITSADMNVQTEVATTHAPVATMEFLLDDQPLGSKVTYKNSVMVRLPISINNGFHNFKVKVSDEYGNNSSASINLNILLPESVTHGRAYFKNIHAGDTVLVGSFPKAIEFIVDNPSEVRQVDLFVKQGDGSARWLGVASSFIPVGTINWSEATAGVYQMSLVATLTSGATVNGESISLEVK